MAKKSHKPPRLDRLDMSLHLENHEYEDQLQKAQHRLRAVQLAYRYENRRALVVFEGWDAAGKGGAIRRMSVALDPRGFKVWPIAAPLPDEQGRHYLYRFWQRLPELGSIAVFDRSWYGRVLVERVEHLVDKRRWRQAYDEINAFEAMLIDDGARLVKIFLHISAEEQLRRFEERMRDPFKRWKITTADFQSRAKRALYERAIDEMFVRTSTARAPWHLVSGECKNHARVRCLTILADVLAPGCDLRPAPLDAEVARLARKKFGIKLPRDMLGRG